MNIHFCLCFRILFQINISHLDPRFSSFQNIHWILNYGTSTATFPAVYGCQITDLRENPWKIMTIYGLRKKNLPIYGITDPLHNIVYDWNPWTTWYFFQEIISQKINDLPVTRRQIESAFSRHVVMACLGEERHG